jgi:outer membrane protein assembly factor BamB
VADDTNPPVKWSTTEGVRWKVPLPGQGVGTPIITGERIFLTASDGQRHDQLLFFCLDRRDGRELWRQNFWGTAPTLRHEQKSSMATPTPVTDGQHVWAFFGTGDLFCLDLDGNLVWCRSLAQEYEPFQNRFAMASSPVLVGDLLILQCDHWGRSYLIGIDKRTGKNVWKTDREEHISWSSPLVADVDGRQEVVVCATFQVKGYDPLTGRELWASRGLTRECIPTAVAGEGMIFAVSGPKGETLALRAGGRGDVSETHVVWRTSRGAPFVPSPLLLDGLYCLVDDQGIASCFQAQTGERVWQNRLGGAVTASPVAAAGKIYFIDEQGTTSVVQVGGEFELLSKNQLDEPVFASPAIANQELFIRTDHHLFCIMSPKQ